MMMDDYGIPAEYRDCTLESYPRTLPPALDDSQTPRIAQWFTRIEAGDQPLGLYLYGPVGSGKTGLAAASLRLATEQGYDGWFTTVPRLLQSQRDSFGDRGESPMAYALRIDVLLLDDLGAERPTGWAMEQLDDLIRERVAELRPTIVTSNFTLPEIAERLGARVADRLGGFCEFVHVPGPSLRIPAT